VTLRCSPDELSKFDSFTESHYINRDAQVLDDQLEHYHYFPFRTSEFGDAFEDEPWFMETECIPQGELAIHSGAEVYARDGKIGQVDEFLISPKDEKISHLVLREGHLWGQKLVTIPVSEIDRIEPDLVYLKLNKQDIQKLPVIPVKRHFPWRHREIWAGNK
jgi:sporulation protein YlmC with PRC-barrel domain